MQEVTIMKECVKEIYSTNITTEGSDPFNDSQLLKMMFVIKSSDANTSDKTQMDIIFTDDITKKTNFFNGILYNKEERMFILKYRPHKKTFLVILEDGTQKDCPDFKKILDNLYEKYPNTVFHYYLKVISPEGIKFSPFPYIVEKESFGKSVKFDFLSQPITNRLIEKEELTPQFLDALSKIPTLKKIDAIEKIDGTYKYKTADVRATKEHRVGDILFDNTLHLEDSLLFEIIGEEELKYLGGFPKKYFYNSLKFIYLSREYYS